jgi:hypothetical protein
MSEFLNNAVGSDGGCETRVVATDMENVDMQMMDGLARFVIMAIRGGANSAGDQVTIFMPPFDFGDDPAKLEESGEWEVVARRIK